LHFTFGEFKNISLDFQSLKEKKIYK